MVKNLWQGKPLKPQISKLRDSLNSIIARFLNEVDRIMMKNLTKLASHFSNWATTTLSLSHNT